METAQVLARHVAFLRYAYPSPCRACENILDRNEHPVQDGKVALRKTCMQCDYSLYLHPQPTVVKSHHVQVQPVGRGFVEGWFSL